MALMKLILVARNELAEFQDGGKITTTVYDNESDAENYFNEMKDRYGDPGRVRIDRSMLVRRVTDITTK